MRNYILCLDVRADWRHLRLLAVRRNMMQEKLTMRR